MSKRQQQHDIIREKNVGMRRDLVDQLQVAGYGCTQATVSRNIKDMDIEEFHGDCRALPEEMRLQRAVFELVEVEHVIDRLRRR